MGARASSYQVLYLYLAVRCGARVGMTRKRTSSPVGVGGGITLDEMKTSPYRGVGRQRGGLFIPLFSPADRSCEYGGLAYVAFFRLRRVDCYYNTAHNSALLGRPGGWVAQPGAIQNLFFCLTRTPRRPFFCAADPFKWPPFRQHR